MSSSVISGSRAISRMYFSSSGSGNHCMPALAVALMKSASWVRSGGSTLVGSNRGSWSIFQPFTSNSRGTAWRFRVSAMALVIAFRAARKMPVLSVCRL